GNNFSLRQSPASLIVTDELIANVRDQVWDGGRQYRDAITGINQQHPYGLHPGRRPGDHMQIADKMPSHTLAPGLAITIKCSNLISTLARLLAGCVPSISGVKLMRVTAPIPVNIVPVSKDLLLDFKVKRVHGRPALNWLRCMDLGNRRH